MEQGEDQARADPRTLMLRKHLVGGSENGQPLGWTRRPAQPT
jgi:hypothetical protein